MRNEEEGNKQLALHLKGVDPVFAGRLSVCETNASFGALSRLEDSRYRMNSAWIGMLESNAGIKTFSYPDEANCLESLYSYSRKYAQAVTSATMLGCWDGDMGNIIKEAQRHFTQPIFRDESTIFHGRYLEPYYFDDPWSQYLAGKKVLVISPFVDSIFDQYEERRELLFENKNTLPEFDLKLVKPPVTLAGNSEYDWSIYYNDLQRNVSLVDFDVALVSCGGYGMLICDYIHKALDKSAIYMGGALPLLFGIYGARWEKHPVISKLINRNWVRPTENERPTNYKQIENGCYW